ncbi:hypothetical protein F469_04549 [Pseudomonas sp. URMO17WK12:I2]|jgi:hypothetical protein|nr:hypothetical protein F469_04549 [Pseudomonas sp. URMO17WK12:I2]
MPAKNHGHGLGVPARSHRIMKRPLPHLAAHIDETERNDKSASQKR